MEKIYPQFCRLIILTYAESLQPKADGSNHVFSNAKANYCISSVEVAIFRQIIESFLQPKTSTRE